MSIDLASLTARLSPEQQRVVKARYRTQAKNPTTAFLLCFFLGIFGAHRFYLGDVAGGLVRLVLSPLIIPGLVLEIFDLPRIDAEVAHHNLAAAESIIARVMLDHPDPHFQSQAGQLVDASLAHAAERNAAPEPAPATDAGAVAPAAAVAGTAAAAMATAVAAAKAGLAAHPEPAPPAPEPAPAPVAPAPSPAAVEAAGPPPPVWPVSPEYQPEPPAAAYAPPELRHETDTTPYTPYTPLTPEPAPAPDAAQTVPWGEVSGVAAAGGLAAAILGAHDAPPAAVPLSEPPAVPQALAGVDHVDHTDQAANVAQPSALADPGEPLGERVHVELPEAGAAAEPGSSTLVFQHADASAAPEGDAGWWTAAAIGGGAAAALGGAALYEHATHHEPPVVEEPPAALEAPIAAEPPATPPIEPAPPLAAAEPAPAEPEHHTVKRVRVVRRLMVDGKVVQETAAEEVVDADADTAATAARLRESLGATDPDTLASLAQQSVEGDREP